MRPLAFLRGLSVLLLVIAFFGACWWFVKTPEFEPAVTMLALLAAVASTLIERSLERKERRRELLYALVHELYMNLQVFADEKFKPLPTSPTAPVVYPRLNIGVLESTVASGAFAEGHDRTLFALLHDWLQRAQEFNHRLLLMELRTFANPDLADIAKWQAGLSSGRVLKQTKGSLVKLASHVCDHYSNESGIKRETVLFPTTDGD